MKTIPSGMQAHLAGELTSLCSCWKVTRIDGQVFRFTDHDADVIVDGDTYVASVGYQRTAVANNSGANVDNVEVTFIGLDPDDIRAGLFDYAEVRMFLVNWADTSIGAINMRRGFIGELTTTSNGVGKGELRGLTQVFTRKIVEVYSQSCRADLFDTRCGVDKARFEVQGVVTSVTSRRLFKATLSPLSGSPTVYPTVLSGFYDQGEIKFTTGANAGHAREIRSFADGEGSPSVGDPVFTMLLKEPFDVEVGDVFLLLPGCDKDLATCRDKYQNVLNFRGEPYIPGTDALLATDFPQGDGS